jgi:diguanylate cyclase (GGDEF)-like protein
LRNLVRHHQRPKNAAQWCVASRTFPVVILAMPRGRGTMTRGTVVDIPQRSLIQKMLIWPCGVMFPCASGARVIGCGSILAGLFGFGMFGVIDQMTGARSDVVVHFPWAFVLACTSLRFQLTGFAIFFVLRALSLARAESMLSHFEREQQQAARFDRLTGLHSRSFGEELLATTDFAALRVGVIIDARRFNEVNSCFGYAMGDQVLQEIGARLRDMLPGANVLARVTADEFVYVSHVLESEIEGRSIVESLAIMLERPFHGKTGISVDFAIGATFAGDATITDREFMKRCDIALHQAKTLREGGICYFRDELAAVIRRSRLVELHLRKAIEAQIVQPFLQPIVTLSTGEIAGFEILARWTDAELGVIHPVEFIPVAEKSGLVGKLSAQLLTVACRKAALWPGRIKLSLNMSPAELSDPAAAARLLGILEQTAFPPSRLQVEITESAELQKSQCESDNLKQLRAAGVKVALDDFGTGFCSFERLVSESIDVLKIDKSFVLAMDERDEMAAIVIASVQIAKQFGLRVTAEGVETEAQLHSLMRIGCDDVQGYLLGRPMPLPEAHRLVMEAASQRAMRSSGHQASDLAAPIFA